MNKTRNGFTLVEMAVVVFLIGILATMGLSAANALLASSSISNTKKKQEIIKDALITYLGTNKRLPCPAIDVNGVESRVATPPDPRECKGYFGLLPYQTLGLPKSAALDGWDNLFSYAVSQQWTLTFSPAINTTSTSNVTKSFNIGDAGDINIDDRVSAISPNIVAVVISHGINGLGGFTSKGNQSAMPVNGTDEFINAPNPATWAKPATLYQREYTEVNTAIIGAFDDVVLRLGKNELIAPLIKDGALKSAESQWIVQSENIKSAVIGFIMASSNIDCSVPTQIELDALLIANNIPQVDPWGDSISANYTRNFCNIRNNGTVELGIGCAVPALGTVTSYTISSPNGGAVNGETNTTLYGKPSFNNIIQSKCL